MLQREICDDARPGAFSRILLLLLLSLPFVSPLLNSHWIMVGESIDQILRVIELDRGLREGSLYPRWFGDLAGGFGIPYFVFYAPLIYYVTEIFHLLGLGIVPSLKLMILVGVFVSGIGMFLLARAFWGEEGGVVSAVVFMYVPYRMVNVYIRGDFAEAFAMALFPLVLYFFHQLGRQRANRYWLGAVFSYAALILTHNCSALIFSGFLVLFIFFFALREKQLQILASGLAGMLWACCLSAVFWLPALLEKKWVNIHLIHTNPALDFRNNFLEVASLLSSTWNLEGGIGGRDLPFQIGWPHLLLAFFSVFYLMQLRSSEQRTARQNAQFFLLCGLLALFCTHPSSGMIWENLPLVKYLQFPWRFLSVLSVFVSLLCGGLFVYFLSVPKGTQKMFQIVLLVVILLVVVPYARVKGYYVLREETLTPAFVKSDGGTVSACNTSQMDKVEDYGEYMPRDVKRLPPKDLAGKIVSRDGKATILGQRLLMERYEFTVLAEKDTEMIVGSFCYPGWSVRVNGEPFGVFTDEEGLIHFTIPRGEHSVEVFFGDTWERTLGKVLSLAALLAFGLLAYAGRSRTVAEPSRASLLKSNGSP